MTDSDSQPTPSAPAASKSSTRTIIIVVLAIVVLAGGGFVAYKLTNKKDSGNPPYKVAKNVEVALVKGDSGTIASLSTAQGKAQLATIKASELNGLIFGACQPAPAAVPTKLCTFSRPGGQLQLWLIAPNKVWLVNQAHLGPAGVAPTPPSS